MALGFQLRRAKFRWAKNIISNGKLVTTTPFVTVPVVVMDIGLDTSIQDSLPIHHISRSRPEEEGRGLAVGAAEMGPLRCLRLSAHRDELSAAAET